MNDIEGGKTSDFLNQNAAGLETFSESGLREVSSNQAPLMEKPANEITEPSAQLLLVPMCILVITWVMSFSRRVDFRKSVGKKLDPIKHGHQIPCSSCRFFKNEPELKCAVHPLNAVTTEAINCPDFWALGSNKFYQ